ncbi:formate dehydrogenase subunit delta [Marivibrio halodurans]|uniref:Formate dehydrogenase subunit delta n=1 Tax=Marivibrio halodurans TaxID=2039722 RepID=A0A8J7RZF2_9PROT|nr:formate dehydrogenase subunit delta [Marivibrio halodurans]MBP5857522.1 formate dehydrogenase subunit delta [Marivibrio halodurans]
MSETIQDLTRMANQIADFFRAYPEAEALDGIAGHIRDFWTRPMRDRLDAHIAAGGEGLDPFVIKALSPASQDA